MNPRVIAGMAVVTIGVGIALWWLRRPVPPPPVAPTPVVEAMPAVEPVPPPAKPPAPVEKPRAKVVVGPIAGESLARLSVGRTSSPRTEGSKEYSKTWCGILLPEPLASTLGDSLQADLGQLGPDITVLLSTLPPTATGSGCLVEIGDFVPEAVTRAVLLAARRLADPVLVASTSISKSAITISVPRPGVGQPLPTANWQALEANTAGRLKLPSLPAPAPAIALPAALLADLDFRTGPLPGRWEGVTWTPDGLRLLGAPLPRRPATFPKQEDYPVPPQPYRAAVPVPGVAEGHRAVTVTLVVALAALGNDQDHLFSLGWRSRWLGLQVNESGRLRMNVEDGWRLAPALGEAAADLPPLERGVWQVISVSHDETAATALIAVGNRCSDPIRLSPATRPGPPRYDGPDEHLFTFIHPTSGRHVHGLVARLLVQRGCLTAPDLLALHARLAPTSAPLDLAGFALPPPPVPPRAPNDDLPSEPMGAKNF